MDRLAGPNASSKPAEAPHEDACSPALQRISAEILGNHQLVGYESDHEDEGSSSIPNDASGAPFFAQHRHRIVSKNELSLEERILLEETLAFQETATHCASKSASAAVGPIHKRVGFFAGFSRLFSGASGSGGSAIKFSLHDAVIDDAGDFPITSIDEIATRYAQSRAEQIYDAPFADLSKWLRMKRHHSFYRDLCSLSWLTSGIEFDEKVDLMKVCDKYWFDRFFFHAVCLFLFIPVTFTMIDSFLRSFESKLSRFLRWRTSLSARVSVKIL
jgi:hypothetical protein